MAEFWGALQEARVLAQIADARKFGFVLRGSTVPNLFDLRGLDSLFAAVTPFSDLDFVVENRGAADLLSFELGTRLPRSGFVRVDIRPIEDLARYESSNLYISGEPAIQFGEMRAPFPVTLQARWNGEEIAIDEREIVRPAIELRTGQLALEEILVDLSYVLRRHPEWMDSEAVRTLLHALLETEPRRMVELTRSVERRLVFSLVKLVLAQSAGAAPDARAWLPEPFWRELGAVHDNEIVRKAALMIERPPRHGAIAAAVPRPLGRRWRSFLERLDALPEVAEGVLWRADLAEGQLHAGMPLPPITILTDDPERPGCCRYRDFGRGAVEIGWSGPRGPDADSFVMVKADEEEFFLAPALMSSKSGQHSTRIDYGLVCQLSGRARTMYVLYAGAADA